MVGLDIAGRLHSRRRPPARHSAWRPNRERLGLHTNERWYRTQMSSTAESTARTEPSIQWRTLSIDCVDADLMAEFYSKLLGWEVGQRGDVNPRTGGSGWVTLDNPTGGIRLAFGAAEWYEPPVWPEEPGQQAKMMHFEIGVDDLEASISRVLEAGGSISPHQPEDRDQDAVRIMLDPSGHPFCLFVLY